MGSFYVSVSVKQTCGTCEALTVLESGNRKQKAAQTNVAHLQVTCVMRLCKFMSLGGPSLAQRLT